MPNPFDEFHTPPNSERIDKIYVGMSEDAQGKNGICAAVMPYVGSTPMVTASEKVLKVFREQAGWAEQRTGIKIKFFEFHRGEEIEAEE